MKVMINEQCIRITQTNVPYTGLTNTYTHLLNPKTNSNKLFHICVDKAVIAASPTLNGRSNVPDAAFLYLTQPDLHTFLQVRPADMDHGMRHTSISLHDFHMPRTIADVAVAVAVQYLGGLIGRSLGGGLDPGAQSSPHACFASNSARF